MIRKIYTAAVSLLMFSCFTNLSADAITSKLSSITPVRNENGVISFDNGEVWYKADNFKDGRYYLIGVTQPDGSERILSKGEGDEAYPVLHYINNNMVNSRSEPFSALFLDDACMRLKNGSIDLSYSWSYSRLESWDYSDGYLSFNDNGSISYLRYDENLPEAFSSTNDKSKASPVNLYTSGEYLAECIGEQPYAETYVLTGSDYKAPVFTVGMKNEDIIPDNITWFIDDEEQSANGTVFTAEELKGRPSGTYNVYCIVEAHDKNKVHYRERSEGALFVVANGIIENSFLTFSDVHEEYSLISSAIADIMKKNDGCIPSLVLCSGDFVNGPQASYERLMYKYLPMIRSHLGGIPSVYVSGNHESSQAASEMTISCGLGADESFSDGCGLIFSGNKTSPDITVYGINYASVESETENDTVFSYDKVKNDLQSFLEDRAKNYHGELIVISAHAGLHTVGIQPESVDPDGSSVTEWAGTETYNISGSYDLAELINEYAEKYDMDIMYLFGHNHSRGEVEFILTDGSELYSTVNSKEKTYKELPISFTYAHAGFLSNMIGSADSHYSFIRRDHEKITYELTGLNDNTSRITVIPLKYKPEETGSAVTTISSMISSEAVSSSASETTYTTSSSAVSSVTTAPKKRSPFTADDFGIAHILIPAAALLVISRKRR